MRARRSLATGGFVAGALGFALAATALVACDLPVGAPSDGPHVLEITPSLTDAPIDRQATLRIELDRRITPASVVDGVVEITSGDNFVWLDQRIDVVHPAIVVTPIDPMDPDVNYAFRVHVLYDFDGRASVSTPRTIFHTSDALGATAPTPITFADVAPVFTRCGTGGCHAGSGAPLGLDLSSPAAIRATAIGVPSREERAAVDGYLDTQVSAAMIGLARIAPGVPARSYLLYKVLGDPHIGGDPMPPTGELLTGDDLVLLQRWIFAGAPTD